MLRAHRPWSKDAIPPYSVRLPLDFNGKDPVTINSDDYGISSRVDPWYWVYLTKVGTTQRGLVYCFYTRQEAETYIAIRCEPQSIEPKFQTSICSCGSKVKGWDYRYINNTVVYAHCNDCKKPLYDSQREEVNKFAINDIDLFDLLL